MKKIIYVIISTIFLSGCASNQIDKQSIGTIGGVIIGALVGKQLGGDSGAILGAAVGGVIGNQIGKRLDEADKQRIAELEIEALETGNSQSYVTNKTKDDVTITPEGKFYDASQPFQISSSISQQNISLSDSFDTVTYTNSPIYSDLNASSKPLFLIKDGSKIHVSGKVIDKDWVVIGNNNVGIGYIPTKYIAEYNPNKSAYFINKVEVSNLKSKKTKKVLSKSVPKAPVIIAKNSEDIQSDLLKVSASPELTQKVSASVECNTITKKFSIKGEENPVIEKVKYCKQKPNVWKSI